MPDSFSANPPSSEPVFFVGTSGWTYDHWKGRFYPPGLPKSRWFDYYVSQFNSVEVNATFYRTFKSATYEKWRQRAPQPFGYVLKAPRLITHRKYLVDVDEDIRLFYESCEILQDRFKLILLQIAPQLTYNLPLLERALNAFPDPSRVAVEFRRPEWLTPQTENLLSSLGSALCNVDSPRQRLTDYLTSPSAYLRLHGRLHWYSYNYSQDELQEIASLARRLVQQGAQQVYIFFNNDFEGYAPANAQLLKSMLAGW